jgi:Ca2+-binding EF-hand superfamily protein
MGCGASAGTKPAPAAEPAPTPAAKMDDTKLVEETVKKPPAAGSGLGARYAATKRRQKVMDEIISRFDASQSGSLTKEEVKELMVKAWGDDFVPSDDDVDLVMRVGGDSCLPEITHAELPAACAIVKALAEEASKMGEIMEMYDKDKSGELDKAQLADLLKDLNGGEAVPDEDVQSVLKQADVSGTGALNVKEVKPAVMAWYASAKDA